MAITKVDVHGLTDLPARTSQRAPAVPAMAQPAQDAPNGGSGSDASTDHAAHMPAPIQLPNGASVRFFIDQDTGKTVATLVDPQSGEVLRQIPSAEALALAKAIGKQQGLVLDLKV
jgi:flagellar protein FlaG